MKARYLFLIFLILVLAAGLYLADRFIKTKQYDGLADFIPSLIRNATDTAPADDTLYISMSDSAFAKIKSIREKALRTGIIINPEDPWVKGKIAYRDDTLKVKMRLKGKMTDHVKGDKWSFRIKTKKNKLLFGMHRFSIQHPGTRNYLYEWMHLQMSRELGIMSLNYRFIRVFLNGKDLGIYAVEENFDRELPFNNQKPAGPVFRFDPDAYWEYRLLGHTGFKLKPEYTEFQSAFIDPMRSRTVKDEKQRRFFEEALILMNAFREQKATASEVLEIDLFARRYALLDLIGGFKSVDWSDLKFYYNPLTKKIEPVAYESFSGFRIRGLIGFDKFRPDAGYHDDFHTLLFSDTAFYALYYRYLQEFSKGGFIDDFLTRNDSSIAHNIRILNNEFPYKRFDRRIYDYNAKVIYKLTHPRYPLQVFVVNSPENRKMRSVIKVGNVSALPVEVLGVWRDDEFYPVGQQVIPPKPAKGFAEYREIEIGGIRDFRNARLMYCFPGSDEKEGADIFLWDRPATQRIAEYPPEQQREFSRHTGIMYDIKENKVIFRPGEHIIDFPLIIPDSMEVTGFSPLTIRFRDKGMIVSSKGIKLKGTPDNPVKVITENNNGGFVIISAKGDNRFENVVFGQSGKPVSGRFAYPAFINVYRASLEMKDCLFKHSSETVLYAADAKVVLENTAFADVKSGIYAAFSNILVKGCAFADIGGNAISLDASELEIRNSSVTGCSKKAINLEKWSRMDAVSLKTENNRIALAVKSGSEAVVKNWQTSENETDIDLKSKTGYGISTLKISGSGKAGNFVTDKDEESKLMLDAKP